MHRFATIDSRPTKRFAIWHFTRWFSVPVAGLSVIVGSSFILTGYAPWQANVADTVATVAISTILAGWLVVRLIGARSIRLMVAVSILLLALSVSTWIGALQIARDDTVLGGIALATGLPFFLSVLVFKLRLLSFINSAQNVACLDQAARTSGLGALQ